MQRAVAQHDCVATPEGVHSSQHRFVAARTLAKRPTGMTLDKYSLEFTRGEVGLCAGIVERATLIAGDVGFCCDAPHAL